MRNLLRRKWSALRASQFGVLFRVFLAKVVDLEILSGDADTSRLVGQFLTIFFGLSCVFSVPVPFVGIGSHRMPQSAAWTAEHFLIATSMVAAGLMSILTWDAAFPDRHDLLVLIPLPVRARTLFAAKTAALFAGPGMAVLALNAVTGLLWPMLLTSGRGGWLGVLPAWPAYWLTTAAAGVFVFCALLAVQGLAANLLSRQIFLRASAAIQAVALCLLLSVYFLEPSLESVQALSAPANQAMLRALPTYWFLGMFQSLNGSMHPLMAPLARRAWLGLVAAVLGAGASLLLAYVRLLSRIVEEPEIRPMRSRAPAWSRIPTTLTRTIAVFSVRSLLRSRQHRVVLSFYIGVGLTILVAYLRTQTVRAQTHGPHAGTIPLSLLVVSMVMVILAVMAVRVVVSLPLALNANWIFQVTQVRKPRVYAEAVRTTWFLSALWPVWLVVVAALAPLCGPLPLAEHLVLLWLAGALLVEICAASFGKIPFTCSYLPGKANIHFVFWIGLATATVVLRKLAVWELRVLAQAWVWALTVVCLATLWLTVRWLVPKLTNSDGELMFEEKYPPVVISLKLS